MFSRKIKELLFCFLSGIVSISETHAQPYAQDDLFIVQIAMFGEAVGTNGQMFDQEAFNRFLKLPFKIREIPSGDFLHFKFYKVTMDRGDLANFSPDNCPMPFFDCDGYIVAVNGNSFFRLKGFRWNDFLHLYDFMQDLHYENLGSKKKFLKSYEVEGIDFACLYDRFLGGNKTPKGSCLKGCFEVMYTE
jgi:hypothetical protein